MKDVKAMLKDAAILFAITLIAGLMLGAVYQITKDPIAKQEELKFTQACQEVYAEAVSFEKDEAFDGASGEELLAVGGYSSQTIDSVTAALNDAGEVVGYVLTVTTHEGYGGDIQFTMGITNEGVLNGISLLSISETPGLGMNAEDVLIPQFAGKSAEKFEYTKTGAAAENQVDAISGATITTEAITDGVNAGLYYFNNHLKGGA